jgi:hypothetical protein
MLHEDDLQHLPLHTNRLQACRSFNKLLNFISLLQNFLTYQDLRKSYTFSAFLWCVVGPPPPTTKMRQS